MLSGNPDQKVWLLYLISS